MSGFDFDALRDPVAPEPGDRERAGVHARARQMKGRARRTRIAAGATSLVAIVVIALVAVAATRTTEPSITVEGGASTTVPPSTTPNTYGPSTTDARFIPPTTMQDGKVVLPVTLPDGETFTMKYPPAMKIAQLGFAGGINVAGTQVQISYTTIQHAYRNSDKPIHVYRGANGSQVYLFHATQRAGYVGPVVDELAYQFGHWLAVVEAPSGSTGSVDELNRAFWALGLSGTEDANGYLVLHSDTLAIGNAFDGGFGRVPGNNVELASHLYCGQPESDTSAHRRLTNGDGTKGVSWCDGELHVSAGGADNFINLADTQLQISALHQPVGTSPVNAPTTTTTSTTAPSPAHNSPPVSASWVSPDHGWVLEQSGSIAQTTDGGTTWHTVGSLGKGYWDNARIRFIGDSDGFAFGIGTSPLLITHDAGATWIKLDTPFATTYDLSISQGMVYVVGMLPNPNGYFGIWSTPVEHLVWKRDPLSLEIGGGPAPTDQVVLSHSGGWIINVDRTVISGARLSGTHWVAWNPPCTGKNGPAYLSASTPTDLVATCNEGVWGPPQQATTVYFSHDGGTTFTRSVAPGFGPVAAANPTTAIIGGNGTLWRTTNGGRSWSVVARFSNPDAIPSDLGFTTTTQGFVISQNNEFLMTHDAGATWKKVTLP
jgi:hypothetical protein